MCSFLAAIHARVEAALHRLPDGLPFRAVRATGGKARDADARWHHLRPHRQPCIHQHHREPVIHTRHSPDCRSRVGRPWEATWWTGKKGWRQTKGTALAASSAAPGTSCTHAPCTLQQLHTVPTGCCGVTRQRHYEAQDQQQRVEVTRTISRVLSRLTSHRTPSAPTSNTQEPARTR